MIDAIDIKFKELGKNILCQTAGAVKGVDVKFKHGDYVIAEIDRVQECGRVVSGVRSVSEAEFGEGQKAVILRIAAKEDFTKIKDNKIKARDAQNICAKKIAERKLAMKLIDAHYSLDRSKIIFYFAAEGRVDFRDLVKDLAQQFHARIELKQIGVRDEAKLLGGLGPCGRHLCCMMFLEDFAPVSIRMAKEQNLPLSPTKTSGVCGRLMCCLSYEHEAYKQSLKGLPKEGDSINTKEGKGKVVAVNPMKRSVIAELGEGKQVELFYDAENKCLSCIRHSKRLTFKLPE